MVVHGQLSAFSVRVVWDNAGALCAKVGEQLKCSLNRHTMHTHGDVIQIR